MRVLPYVLGGAAVLLVAGYLLLSASTPAAAPAAVTRPAPVRTAAPATTNEEVHLACAFKVGDQSAFTVVTDARASGAGAPAEGDRFSTTWSWQVVKESPPGQWLVATGFSGTELRQVITDAALRPTEATQGVFLLQVDKDCRFIGLGMPKAWKVNTRRFVASIVRSVEMRVSSGSTGASWEFTQADGMGRFRASYNAVRGEGGAWDVTRTKLAYRDGHGPKGIGIRPELLGGSATGSFDARGAWFRTLRGRERMRLKAEGRLVADLTQEFTLARDDLRFALKVPADLSDEAFSFDDPFTLQVATERPLDPALRGLSLPDALARFGKLYNSNDKGDAYAAALFLSDWLRARPEMAAQLLAALRNGGIPEAQQPALFLALELCGTGQAHAVLVEALGDAGMSFMNRARAASALSDVPTPNAETVTKLVEQARVVPKAGDQQGQILSGGSVRALGHLGERAEKLDPAMQTQIRDELQEQLHAAEGVSRTVDVVDALGNTGDEKVIPDLSKVMDGESAAVREHATFAFHRMDAEQATPPLVKRLGHEPDPAVRAAIANTLATVHAKDAAAIALVAQLLAKEPNPNARAEEIRFLGSVLPDATAKAALIQQFHRETVPELLQFIGSFVSAEDLR